MYTRLHEMLNTFLHQADVHLWQTGYLSQVVEAIDVW